MGYYEVQPSAKSLVWSRLGALVLLQQASVPLLPARHLVRAPPFFAFKAPFDFSHRSRARRTCSASGIPSRCLTRFRPADNSRSRKKLCSRLATTQLYTYLYR